MPINPQSTSNYDVDLRTFIHGRESFVGRIYGDAVGVPTIGYGIALLTRSGNTYDLRPDLQQLFQLVGVTLQPSDLTTLRLIRDSLNASPPNVANAIALAGGGTNGQNMFSFNPISQTAAANMFNHVIGSYEGQVRTAIGETVYGLLEGSKELMALVSLAYNFPGAIYRGSNLARHLNNGDRAAAWFEIRYLSDRDNEVTNRRRAESDMFGLFDSHSYTNFTEQEAIAALSYILPRQALIERKGFTADLFARIGPAKEFIEAQYTDGKSIDNLFTSATGFLTDGTGRDLLLTHNAPAGTFMLDRGGDDYAYGGDSWDTFISIDGNDMLHGRGGDDHFHLVGGATRAYGEEGNDVFQVYGSQVVAEGGSGSDTFTLDPDGASSPSGVTLRGGAGNDTFYAHRSTNAVLEGGTGHDWYVLDSTAIGASINDEDGQGNVSYAGHALSGGMRVGTSNTYETDVPNLTLERVGSDLIIGGNVRVVGFTDGDLGIYLRDSPEDPEPPTPPAPPSEDEGGGSVSEPDPSRGNSDAIAREPYMPALRDLQALMNSALANPSPLVLDLDGDGIELTSYSECTTYFDLTGSGFRMRTGWVTGGDGLLALDLSGNGVIDSGRELFGDYTGLANGALAAQGFQALAQYDGDANGRIDANDAVFGNLRVWVDGNLDAVSQTSELQTLADAGIQSLNLSFATGGSFVQGNELRYTSTFVTSGGQVRNTADIYFAVDSVDSVASAYVQESAATQALPDAFGFGQVRNLRQAIELDQSGLLRHLVQSYAEDPALARDRSALAAIAFAWAGTADIPATETWNSEVNLRQLRTIEAFLSHTFSQARGLIPEIVHEEAFPALLDYVESALARQTHLADFYSSSVFNAQTLTWTTPDPAGHFQQYFTTLFAQDSARAAIELGLLESNRYLRDDVPNAYAFVETSGAHHVRSSTPASTVVTADLSDTVYVTGADTTIETHGGDDVVDVTGASATVDTGFGSDLLTISGGGHHLVSTDHGDDTIELAAGSRVTLDAGAGADTVVIDRRNRDAAYGLINTIAGGAGNDHLFGSFGNETYVYAIGDGHDVIDDAFGFDSLSFGAGISPSDLAARRVGNDWVIDIKAGGDPNLHGTVRIIDWFVTNHAFERLVFADGTVVEGPALTTLTSVQTGTDADDVLRAWHTTANTLAGAGGSDRLEGFDAADTYVFNRGDGTDVISDRPYYWTSAGADRIVFGNGIGQADLSVARSGNDLVISIVDPSNPSGTDRLTIEGWFEGADRRIESFQFADGTNLTAAQVHERALVVTGTDGADTLSGWQENNTIYGLGGDDIISDSGGHDSIQAGGGNDTVTDSGGDDTIEGGDGDDTITDQGSGTNVLRGGGGNDIITFEAPSNNTLEGGDGNDVLKVSTTNFNNSSYTNTFRGGLGNDRMEGAASADTYYFNRGDGSDTIYDFANWGSATDRIVFGSGITQADLSFSHSGNHLVIRINDPANPTATDQITMERWFSHFVYGVESLQFADGTSLTRGEIDELARVVTGTNAADTLSGWWDDNTIYGLGGNDTITDSGGNDTIDGGDGDDAITDQNSGTNVLRGGAGNDTVIFNPWSNNTVEGGSGNDVLRVANQLANGSSSYSNSFRGGGGNDRMEGGSSADTYLFDRGDAQDVINDRFYSGTSNADRLLFGGAQAGNEVLADQLWLQRNGNHLVVSVIGTGDSVTIENWYAGSVWRVEQIKSSDGRTLLDSQVENLVSAMAGFAPPPPGQTTLSQEYRDALGATIAANWQ